MTGLREVLEDMCVKADRREAMRREEGTRPVPARVGVDVLRSLLNDHPAESAPIASQERVTEVIKEAQYRQSPAPADYLADALLAAGVFRDEATVKAEVATQFRRDAIDEAVDGKLNLTAVIRMATEAGGVA
ncbi:hypothetical protein ACFPJ1_40490 [Kribbella qitaiheensis]|uniref:hypothetical protein n=1 Tax=Kribbella qitaiheensis TaxID=1544730 RepID=UPI003622DD00